MQADLAERAGQAAALLVVVGLATFVAAWRPQLNPVALPQSAAPDVELSVEAPPPPAPAEQPAAEAPATPPPLALPSPPEPPPEPPPSPPPAPAPADVPTLPRPRLRPRVPMPRPPRAPPPQPAPAPPAQAYPPPASAPPVSAPPVSATPQGSPTADNAYTAVLRSIIDRRNVPPDTAEYRSLRPHGTAEVRYKLGRSGTVSEVQVTRSSGSPMLDRAAVANVSAGGYPPMPSAVFTGQAERIFTIRITFNPTGGYDPE